MATFWARPDAPPRRARWGVLLTMPDLYRGRVKVLRSWLCHVLQEDDARGPTPAVRRSRSDARGPTLAVRRRKILLDGGGRKFRWTAVRRSRSDAAKLRYVSALSAIFVHQLSTCMDLVNLAGTGAKTAAGDGDLVKAELRTFAAARNRGRDDAAAL